MSNLTIRNATTGEIIDLSRDVRTRHPAWAHAQCGTNSETELQAMMDQMSYEAYVAAGRGVVDECGIAADIPEWAAAWKYADPTEGAGWLTADEAQAVEREDASLVVYIGA